MKLAQLFENYSSDDILPISTDKLATDCKKFLTLSGKQMMFHASDHFYDHTSHTGVSYFQELNFVPRKKPRDTPNSVHKLMNDMMTEKFGFPFRNGLFASGDARSVESYARSVYAVFPIGEFEWLCDPKIRDMTGTYERSEHQDAKLFVKDLANAKTWLHNTNLKKAIESGSEIMLKPKKFYLLHIEGDLYRHATEDLKLITK